MDTLIDMLGQTDAITSHPFAQLDYKSLASRVEGTWNFFMVMPILLGGLAYLLIQDGLVRGSRFLAFGIICMVLSVILAATMIPTTLDSMIVFAFCAVATGGGVAFLTAREPVYAALGFATAVLSTCGILFMQSALFIAAATMIVYAGATIIIFLFVLMFAQQSELRTYDVKLNNPLIAGVIGVAMLICLVYCVTGQQAFPNYISDKTRPLSAAFPEKGVLSEKAYAESMKLTSYDSGTSAFNVVPSSTAGLGRSLYTDYLLAVELAGTVLLVATIGAIALATKPNKEVNS